MTSAQRDGGKVILRMATGLAGALLLALGVACESGSRPVETPAAVEPTVRQVEGRFTTADTEADWIARFDGDTLLSIAEERRMGEYGSGRAEFFFEAGRLVRYEERSRRRVTDPAVGGEMAAVTLSLTFAADGSLAAASKTVDGAATRPDDEEVQGIRARAVALVAEASTAQPTAPADDDAAAPGTPGAPDAGGSGDSAFLRPDGTPLEAFAYDCEGTEVVTSLDPRSGDLILALKGTRTSLPHVPAASGTRHSDGSVTFWSKGREATLQVGDGISRRCLENRRRTLEEDARYRGLTFRGVGNEPPWVLELGRERIVLFMGYEKARLAFAFAPPERSESGSARSWSVKNRAHSLELTLTDGHCADTMASLVYPTTVAFSLDGKPYRGCGRDLA